MEQALFIILSVLLLLILFVGMVVLLRPDLFGGLFSQGDWRQQVRVLAAGQHAQPGRLAGLRGEGSRPGGAVSRGRMLESGVGDELAVERVSDTGLTFQKKLKYAQLTAVPPFVFVGAQIAISLLAFLAARRVFDLLLQLIALFLGPIVVNWFVARRIERRFKAFDADYPQYLLSLAGLLKTGLNPVQALQSAAESLEEESLLRTEVQIMLERMRLGVPEDKSIGSFGEDILHPEIELFVQALLLSRRVGGNLSDTLDRLSRQVRKRQFFRSSAVSAVGMQRGSIWFILVILLSMEVYLFFMWREAVVLPWQHATGRIVCQGGVLAIIIGVYWVRQVTKIKV